MLCSKIPLSSNHNLRQGSWYNKTLDLIVYRIVDHYIQNVSPRTLFLWLSLYFGKRFMFLIYYQYSSRNLKSNYFKLINSFLIITCFCIWIMYDQYDLLYMTWTTLYLYTIWNLHFRIKSNHDILGRRISGTLVQSYDKSLATFYMSMWFIIIDHVWKLVY